jgi:putative transposase
MYEFRKLTPEQQDELVRERQRRGFPLHEPPHYRQLGGWFLISAATFHHASDFGTEDDREWLLGHLTRELKLANIECAAWVILPNHYHVLVQCPKLAVISQPLRRVHARAAVTLNRRAGTVERRRWYRFSDRQIRSERHYFTTLNYIHYNRTKDGWVSKPVEWACSSIHWYQEHFGIEWLRDLWRSYPVRDYGKGWDD